MDDAGGSGSRGGPVPCGTVEVPTDTAMSGGTVVDPEGIFGSDANGAVAAAGPGCVVVVIRATRRPHATASAASPIRDRNSRRCRILRLPATRPPAPSCLPLEDMRHVGREATMAPLYPHEAITCVDRDEVGTGPEGLVLTASTTMARPDSSIFNPTGSIMNKVLKGHQSLRYEVRTTVCRPGGAQSSGRYAVMEIQ